MSEVLIAALSGRALAAAARASGFTPLVADLFGDADMREIAAEHVTLPGGLAAGLTAAVLAPALLRLAEGRRPIGLVYGAGFEDRPEALARLARDWPLLGNAPEMVKRLKDPLAFARLCAEAGAPHPATQLAPPPAGASGWLVKRRGGGGGHVARFGGRAPGPEDYFQAHAAGAPVSLLVLANGRDARILGASAQWAAPAPDAPWRYGGALRPWRGEALPAMRAAAIAMSRKLGLLGLNSFDFLADGAAATLLEVNPRPGATLDVFTHPRLFSAHVSACRGILPDAPLHFAGAQAAAIVYCEHGVAARSMQSWPVWVCDRPAPGVTLRRGDPVCTVIAAGEDEEAALGLLQDRQDAMRAALEAGGRE